MEKTEFADKLIDIFPDKTDSLSNHYEYYGEMLGHIFFAEEINEPLVELLYKDTNTELIKKYCKFIQDMWEFGTEEVVNIVDVTILERLSDDKRVWHNFGKYISPDFKRYINEVSIPNNSMMDSNNMLKI